MIQTKLDLWDISAECLLNYLYPDATDQWEVECAGTFYRNYSPDVLAVDETQKRVRLSRDSFLRLLPQGVIAPDDALKGANFEQKYERLKRKEELLQELFKPVDTLAFRTRLHLEKQAAQLSYDKLSFLLQRYFYYDLSREENPYIRRTAPLLLLIPHLRGNFAFIAQLLKQLFECEVETEIGQYTWEEGPEYAQPAIEYRLILPGLTSEAYQALNRMIDPFREFLCEWFIPFDTRCTIAIRHPHQPFVLGDTLILDYNTEIEPDSSTQNTDSK